MVSDAIQDKLNHAMEAAKTYRDSTAKLNAERKNPGVDTKPLYEAELETGTAFYLAAEELTTAILKDATDGR